jgi:oligopeptide transport system substrate-binding protein
MANSAATQVICAHIFEPLMRSHNGVIENGAAKSYTMSDDGLVYTFVLRDGLVWSDGKALTAGDYVLGMQRLLDPDVASPFAFFGMVLKNGEAVNSGDAPVTDLGVKALDDKTIEITLEYPAGYFIGMLNQCNLAPARADIVEKQGAAYGNNADANVYCGPFVVSKWDKNDRITLTKNDKYWNKSVVKLETVEILTVQDNNTAVAMFETGELDFADIPVAIASQYPDADYYYNGAADYIVMNQREGYLTANKNLRLALNFGLSRKDYITLATSGVYEANLRFVLPQVSGVKTDYGTEYPYVAFPLEGDIGKAKEYLDAAIAELGFTKASDIVLELMCSDSDTSRTECEVLQNQWQTNLGVKINIVQVDYRQRLTNEANGEFELVSTGWMPDYSDPYTYLELWTTNSPYNHCAYQSAEYDAAMARSITETDPKARMDALFEAEKIFLADGVVVPMQLRRVPYLINPKLSNFLSYFVGLGHDFVLADIAD